MTPELVVTLIVGLLAAVLGGGFWQYRQSRKDAPIQKRDADIAVAETSQQMALASAQRLEADVIRLAAGLVTESEARQELSGRVSSLETRIVEQDRTIGKLRDAVRIFSASWDDLVLRWAVVRVSEIPPSKPRIETD